MPALAMEFGWRRVAAAGGGGGPGPVQLGAAIVAGAAAAMAALSVAAPPAEQAETTALVARMAVAPSPARRTLIDQLIAGLKADAVWQKLDWLVVAAAHDAQAARLNWRGAKAVAAVNAPVFTADRGYAGDGASAYLDLGETFAASGNGYATTSAALGAWVNVAGTTAQPTVFGAGSGGAGGTAPYAATNLSTAAAAGFVNAGGATSSGASGGTGHIAAVRTASNAQALYRDGAQAAAGGTASTSVPTSNAMLLRLGTNYSTARVAAAHAGTALAAADVAALHGRLSTFLTAIGAQ